LPKTIQLYLPDAIAIPFSSIKIGKSGQNGVKNVCKKLADVLYLQTVYYALTAIRLLCRPQNMNFLQKRTLVSVNVGAKAVGRNKNNSNLGE